MNAEGPFVLEWRNAVDEGTRAGPKIFTAGPTIYLDVENLDGIVEAQLAEGYEPNDWLPYVHVLHSLLTGNRGRFPVWFIEGLAETVSGGTTGDPVRGLDQLEDLTSTYERTSPIAFERPTQILSQEALNQFHYPMFQLAVEYLLDEDGLSRSLNDTRNLIIDVGGRSTFAAAFESRMGIGLDEYEAQFFNLMDDYLP